MTQNEKNNPGKLLASYYHPVRTIWHRGGLSILVLFVLAFVGYGIFRAAQSIQAYGPAAAFTDSKGWLMAGGIGLIFLVGGWVVSNAKRPGALVYERMLILPGEEDRLVPWTAISGVLFREKQYRLGRDSYDASLILTDGQRIDLRDWLSGKQLVNLVIHIKARTYRRLDELARQKIQAGEWADFGTISISNEGFKTKTIEKPWGDIASMKIVGGNLEIVVRGKETIMIGVEKIANPELLLRIVKGFQDSDDAQ